MDFIALDVETANADVASICQIGMASFRGGAILEEWKTYVDPEDFFDEINISIHGIDETIVKDAPTFPEIAGLIRTRLDGRIAVCHTHFDRVAIEQASRRYGLCSPTCRWLDSARVARRAWHEFAWRGYGLENACSALGYHFTHHDALEDAKAAAKILLTAIETTGTSLPDWFRRVERPIDPSSPTGQVGRTGNPEGPFYGEVIAFTGALTIPRCEAANTAAQLGFTVGEGVTKNTTMLVIGDQDIRKLAGQEKSSKHRKAEKLIRQGRPIRIVREADFQELIRSYESVVV